jgi:hypothetical protein
MSGRAKIIQDIEIAILSIETNIHEIESLTKMLNNEPLTENEAANLISEIETFEQENIEHRQDIAILEEMLRKFDMDDEEEDTQQETYDGWDEVFTGGDY